MLEVDELIGAALEVLNLHSGGEEGAITLCHAQSPSNQSKARINYGLDCNYLGRI